MIFKKQEKIGNYTITFPHKQGAYAETYRVKNSQGKTLFLKLICLSKLSSSQLDDQGNVIELEIVKQLKHKNICSYVDDGALVYNGQQYVYFVTEYVSGETIHERMVRDGDFCVYDMKQIVLGVLSALKYLHENSNPIIHNEITNHNVLLNLAGELNDLKLIDFGNARFLNDVNRRINISQFNLFYLPSERYNGTYCIQSDLYSVGVLMYHLLYGELPWFVDLSGMSLDQQIERIQYERQKPLVLPSEDIFEMDEQLLNTIKKALSDDIEDRFQTADEFIKAIKGEIAVENPDLKRKIKSDEAKKKTIKGNVVKGNGFADVAGMEELKNQLKEEVIDVLQSPEEYKEYGITIPNGMLLYGPPGCGKTFFAKRFAEEVGFNFMYITPSTLKSKYVNATQENIAQMFKDAEENAPTIIFIDEINEIVPNRDSEIHEMAKSAVNEMLAQMDRTGELGIFIIGATNYPNMIDPAMLRAGRIEKKYYIGPPDKEARKALFELYLKKRPVDFGLDYEHLADLTENYVSADIELIVNDSARMALKSHSKITMEIIEDVISRTDASLPLSELDKFEKIRMEMEGGVKTPSHRKIGFR